MTGKILHISEVSSGLGCNCRCPACGELLVAKKGRRNRPQHHFAHYRSHECRTAAETSIHKFAKQILDERRKLMTPEISAQIGNRSLTKSPARSFTFDHATLERRLDPIVPDVILTLRDRKLLVEVAVTHSCGDDKIASIRALGIPAIEVDLAKVARFASKDEVAAAIIHAAPRKWLYNPKVDRLFESLRKQITDELEARAAKIAASLNAAQWKLADEDRLNAVRRVRSNGFPHVIGLRIEGEKAFNYEPTILQAWIIERFVFPRLHSYSNDYGFSLDFIIEEATREKLIRAECMSNFDDELEASVRRRIPTFLRPQKAIALYLRNLADQGMLDQRDEKWFVTSELRRAWREMSERAEKSRREAEETRERHQETIDQVQNIIELVPESERAGFDVDIWLGASREFHGASSFNNCIDLGGAPFQALSLALREIGSMLRGSYIADELLGLPLESARARCIDQKKREEEARQKAAQAAAHKAAEERAAQLSREAFADLGDEAAAWLQLPCSDLKERLPIELARESVAGLHATYTALAKETDRRTAARAAQLRAESSRIRLIEAAERHFGPERARVFLNSGQPALGNRHPADYCVDDRTLQQCLALLKTARSRRR